MLPLIGCWSDDGKNVLIGLLDRQSRKSTIWKISSDGKERKQITGHHENFYRHLALSPDGKKITFTSTRSENFNFDIWIMDLNIKQIKKKLRTQ
jgi:Tol biopolymer transport system component